MQGNGDQQWRAPGSGTPLRADEAARVDPEDIANAVARKLIVPKGPLRTAQLSLGIQGGTQSIPTSGNPAPSFIANALNSQIVRPVLAAPGIIKTIDFSYAIVTTGAAAGILQLFDNDSNSPLIRQFAINIGAAGSVQASWGTQPEDLPFLNGILAVWTPIIAAFNNSIININIDYRSIPIGQLGLFQ